MIDITRLSKLHAATTQGDWERCQANNGTCQCGLVWSSELDAVVANCGSDPLVADEVPKISDEQIVANSDWVAESHNAWPAVSARLAILEEFARRVRNSVDGNSNSTLLYHYVQFDIEWLSHHAKKAMET